MSLGEGADWYLCLLFETGGFREDEVVYMISCVSIAFSTSVYSYVFCTLLLLLVITCTRL